MLKGGDTGLPAIVPNKPDHSYLMEVIQSDDPEISMPPKGGPLFEDEIELLAKNKESLLTSIPSIQPVNMSDLKRMASGYGYRIDPFTKMRTMHFGMDFSAKTGTPIYATGDGKVVRADNRAAGFGNHVRINHGFGYESIYAHMSRITVKRGYKVKRGDLIGYVGNTGRSVAPHLHYEIIKDGKKINPINFYSGSLSPDEFEMLVNLASQENQSLD